MKEKTCPCCGEENISADHVVCDECSAWVDAVETRWCPLCGSPTDDNICPACEQLIEPPERS